MFALNTAGAIAIGALFADSDFAGVLVGVVFFASAMLSEAVAGWRARRRGADLMPRPDMYRRFFAEKAAESVWRSVGTSGLAMASSATVFALALLPIHKWPLAVLFFAIGGAVGALSGAYAWAAAHQFARSAQRGEQPSSEAQVAMHHYSGYALGLAAALFVAPFYTGDWSPIAVIVVFVVAKFIGDVLAPPVVLNTAAELPSSALGVLRGCAFAIVWWGLPLGVLLAIVVHNYTGRLRPSDAAQVFGIPAATAVAFYLFVTMLMYLTRGRPPASSKAPDESLG